MILIPRPLMSRRQVLRGVLGGATVSVGLPVLNAMLGENGRALAQGEALPTRFGVWFWGNGIRREHWIPDQEGRGWQPKGELAPLIDGGLRDDFSVISGLEVKTATHPHHSGMTGILTGEHYHQVGTTRDTIVSTFASPSLDQIAASAFEGQTPFRSLELGVCRFRGTDEGTTFQHLSHNGPNDVNPSEYVPQLAYERLFGRQVSAQGELLKRQSVLDAVLTRIRTLQGQVGATDRQRLERHFESVRALELRLAGETLACDAPPAPGNFPDVEGREQIGEKNQAMSELLAYALSCDLTRAFSLLFSSAGSGVVVWQAGAANGLHQLCHDEARPQPTVHRAVTYIMEQLTVFLQTLKSFPEGDGTLLDRCSILCTTELSEGDRHSNDEFPVLIAGGGGGRLQQGQHLRLPDANASLAGLSALRGAGLEVERFGVGPGEVRDVIAGLF